MYTLADLKGSEVKLRESLKHENIPEFRADIRQAYRFVLARRWRAESQILKGAKNE